MIVEGNSQASYFPFFAWIVDSSFGKSETDFMDKLGLLVIYCFFFFFFLRSLLVRFLSAKS